MWRASCKLHDHQPERQWRHLDTCQYRTILHAEAPRSECPEHRVRVVKLPWAEPSSRFTALFEALAIEWLKAASQKAVAGLLRLSWDEIHGIMCPSPHRIDRSAQCLENSCLKLAGHSNCQRIADSPPCRRRTASILPFEVSVSFVSWPHFPPALQEYSSPFCLLYPKLSLFPESNRSF